MDECVNDLAVAIIQQAIDDWRYLCKGGVPTKWCNFEELEDFFKHDCEMYLIGTSISHKRLLAKMMRERDRALKRLH